jgi:hypothetical protein
MAARIAHLADWSWSDIKKEWHRLFGSDPPIANRRFVEKRIAYRWQEIEFAKADRGMLESNQRRIDELVATGTLKRQKTGAMPIAGTELIRVYAGVEHRVRVLPDEKFEYAGKRDAPPILSSSPIWSPIPQREEIGREEAVYRRADHRLPA